MKLVLNGHDERYVVEQSLMNLFPGELPVYEPILPGDDTWAIISLREEDRACRMGGDEFAVLFVFDPDVTDAQIRERAQQIFDQVNMRLKAVGEGTGISMGMVIAQPEMTFNQLYEASDKALYQSKETGRGRLTVL